MRVAVSMWSLVLEAEAGRLDVQSFLHYAAQSGVRGVELLDVFWHDYEHDVAQVKTLLRETGLTVSAYAIANDLVQSDEQEYDHQVQRIHAGVDIAQRLAAPFLRVFSGSAKEQISFDEGLRRIVDGLRSGAAYAQERGVTLVLENHGRFAGKADQVRHIIDTVDSPALRANFDTGNFLLVGQDPVTAARELAPLVRYVHLKDFRKLATGEEVPDSYPGLDGSQYVGTVIGAGDVDLYSVLSALKRAAYDGWLSIEYEGGGDARQGLADSIAASQRLIRELAA